MKKSTIWLLTTIMALTFIGLLYVQFMYLDDMFKMRDDQLDKGIRRSLNTVSQMLEHDDTRYFMSPDKARYESSSLYTQYGTSTPHLGGLKYTFSTDEGIEGNLIIQGDADKIGKLQQSLPSSLSEHYNSIHNELKGQYNRQKNLIDEVLAQLLSQSSNRPISERADSTTIRKYLTAQLQNNGISLPFEFAVVNRNNFVQYRTDGFNTREVGENNMYVQQLFPKDPAHRWNYLKVYFPDKKDYVLSSIKFIIPSLAFTFVLLLTFIFTIYLAFRQKKLSEMKNDFINNMTHEFKTPISSISLAAQMLNDDSVRKSPHMLQHISTVIMDETKRLRFQVEKVLQMSMFDRHRATLRPQDVNANVAIENIVKTFKLKVERYGGSLSASLDARNANIFVDEMHFTNVIFNLLDNAVKYRDENRPLKLSVATKDLPAGKLQITVADNGIGIKKEDIKKIFDRFYRVSTGNRHDVKGFGLGLAYVDKIVTAMNGEIKVESEINIGTKFIITLPITKN